MTSTRRGPIDWRGVQIPVRAPAIESRLDASGQRICVQCAAPIAGMSPRARFCSITCRRRRWGARRRVPVVARLVPKSHGPGKANGYGPDVVPRAAIDG